MICLLSAVCSHSIQAHLYFFFGSQGDDQTRMPAAVSAPV